MYIANSAGVRGRERRLLLEVPQGGRGDLLRELPQGVPPEVFEPEEEPRSGHLVLPGVHQDHERRVDGQPEEAAPGSLPAGRAPEVRREEIGNSRGWLCFVFDIFSATLFITVNWSKVCTQSLLIKCSV